MKTSDFDYDLPPRLIAQEPVEPRDSSRLLVLDRDQDKIQHSLFNQLGEYLNPDDLLVVNRTRVIPARLYGKKFSTGGKVEILLLNQVGEYRWEAIVRGKRLFESKVIILDNGMEVVVEKVLDGPRRILEFSRPINQELEQFGHVPLPPYIHTKLQDGERYQTIFAKKPGSSAAPTAGLHFTPHLVRMLMQNGVKFAEIELQIGLDTFAPVTEEDPDDHTIHSEYCMLSEETADLINDTRERGGRIVAVGTTSARCLESSWIKEEGKSWVDPYNGWTDLFILPGYQFKIVDAMITNFHLPKSTLIMMVSAFAGTERILNAYNIAMREGYRFYSFGDAMLIQ